jgi:hypothetical protein
MIRLNKNTLNNNQKKFDLYHISNMKDLEDYLSSLILGKEANILDISSISDEILTLDCIKQLLVIACEYGIQEWVPYCIRNYLNYTLDETYYDPWNGILHNNLNSICVIKACEGGFYKILEYLLEYGMSPNACINQDYNALGIAVFKSDKQCVELLLKWGADVNIEFYLDCFPVHLAILNNNYSILKLLLEKGASPNSMSVHYGNLSATEMAIKMKRTNLIRLLLAYGGTFTLKMNL